MTDDFLDLLIRCRSGSIDLSLDNQLYEHLTKSLIHLNLENPLHLLCITMPFDLVPMPIGFRQLVDRVNDTKK